MSFSVRRIDHVEVVVRDLRRSRRWYRRDLGLRRLRSWDPEPVMVGAGGTKLALFRAPPGERPLGAAAREKRFRRLGHRRVAFLTDRRGFQEAQVRLRRLGITFRGPVDHGGSVSIYFEDPDGIPLEITRPGREAAPGARRRS